MVASLTDNIFCCEEVVASLTDNLSSLLLIEKAGLKGAGMAAVSLLSIEDTSNIVGLWSGFSWMHNRATCMHAMSLQDEDESSSDGSINLMPSPSFHNSYACNSLVSSSVIMI